MRKTSPRFLANFSCQLPKTQPLAIAIGLALIGGLPSITYSQTPTSAEQNQLPDFDLPAAPKNGRHTSRKEFDE